MKFNQVATATYQGTVIVFARGVPETPEERERPFREDLLSSDIYFDVLALNPGDDDTRDWVGFQALALPNTVRPAGMQIINVPSVYNKGSNIDLLQDAGLPVRAKASGDYLYLFRQSKEGSLLVNRFRLVRKSDVKSGETSFALEPAWEVRFQRSGKPDTPADPKDVLNYLSSDKEPFLEPTVELFMLKAGSKSDFDVEFLPAGSGGLACQIFVADQTANTVNLYNLPLDANGDLLFTGKSFNGDNQILPDSSFTIADKTSAGFTLNGAPSAAYYQKQERVLGASSDSYFVKRTGRLMLAMNGSPPSGGPADNTLVTVDFSVAVDGTLATPPAKLIAAPVGPANYAVELGGLSYVQFSGLVLQGAFAIEFWLYPMSNTPDKQRILGNGSSKDAPYAKLVNGSQIEVGFTGVNGKPLACTSPAGTILQQTWSHVVVAFDEAASPKFQIRINGGDTPCEISGEGDKPNGVAVNQIGSPVDGFAGDLDDFRLYNGAPVESSLVAEWPFDVVAYTDDPPTTPNSKDPQNPGKVFGAYLVPAASPVASDNAGSIAYDQRNLTIYTAYIENFSHYGEIKGSPYLLAGSDGLLHCYFRGKDDRFSVLQYDSQAARALFAAPWQTRAGTNETGTVQFVAAQSGAFMNTAAIEIKPLSDADLNPFFCDIDMKSPSGRVETWKGVPRSLSPFVSTLNGQSTPYPADPRLANGSLVFFDASGTYPSAYIPLTQNANGGQMAFVTRIPDRLPLKSVQINATKSAVTLEFLTPRWTDVLMTQTWQQVPTGVTEFLSTLEGLSTSYNYKNRDYCNIKSYSLAAISDLNSANRVVVWTHPSVTKVDKLEVADGAQPNVCEVTIILATAEGTRTATYKNVPRQQGAFALTLENADQVPKYGYGQFASGDHEKIGALLIITTNGVNAAVSNQSAAVPDGNMLAGASLFAAFPTAAVAASERLTSPVGPVAATAFQSACFEVEGKKNFLTNGSQLFPTMPGSVPNQGAVGFVQDTAGLSDGKAYLVRQGVRGGWLDNPAQRCLEFSGANRVTMGIDEAAAPNIGQLTIPGDLTLELWCRPQRIASASTSPNQRLLTFNRRTDPQDDASTVQYMAGLRDCPSLDFVKENTVRAALETTQGTFYTWFAAKSLDAGIIGSVATRGVTAPVLTVSLNADHYLQVAFGPDPNPPPILSQAKIEAGSWYQVAVTFAYSENGSTYSIDTTLYLNGGRQGTAVYSGRDTLELATIVLGDIGAGPKNSLPMRVNETAFFTQPLRADQARQFSEERIPDNFPDLACKWMFIDKNRDAIAVNSSATGIQFSPPIQPSAAWADEGLYFRPVLGYGENIGTAWDRPIIAGWSHLALVHQAGYALKLNGKQYADCGHDSSLELGQQFALEAWFQLDPGATLPSQTILAKGANATADYKLWIRGDYKPVFQCQIAPGGGAEETVIVKGPDAIDVSRAHYLAVNFQVVSVKKDSDGNKVEPEYELHIDLYLDGQAVARGVMDPKTPSAYRRFADAPNLAVSKADLNLGRTPEFGGAGYLQGRISDVRIWSRNLAAEEIAAVYRSHRIPGKNDGLVSYWRFNDGKGKTAFDSQGNNNAKLSAGGLMVGFKPTAANWLYVNGQSPDEVQYADSTSSVGGYGDAEQFNLCYVDAGTNSLGFYGQLDEVRIWNTQLAREQITDSMNRSLSGNEPHLMGLWGFDNGSGATLSDATGRGNNGTLSGPAAPAWRPSTAPLNNESSVVHNILGGMPTFELRTIQRRPAVIDYADVQRDAYGAVFSVMKRGYFFVDGAGLNLATGFKVGDLSTVFIGQVQTDPKLIGFIEGGPPIPSENQTRPYWKTGSPSEYTLYDSASSVEFEEAGETTYTFGVDRDASESDEFSMKGGLFVGGQFGTAEGIGFEVTDRILVFEGHLGAQNKIVSETHSKPGNENKSGTNRTISVGLAPGGSWEPGKTPGAWLNPDVGRRYLPSNVGCAVVKSLTADLYASILASTGMMVKLTVVPNPEIPEDVNLINFPINPKYVKNGSLDGNVGLQPDPDVDPRAPSYFRPVEAYAMKRNVERQEKQLEAYYLQFAADHYASQLINKASWDDYQKTVTDTPAYDWARHLSKRNIVNTYVWTAGGGTYAEQVSAMNVFSENYNATGSLSAGLGAVLDFKLAAPVSGPYVEIDYIHNWKAEVNAVRSKEQSAEFSLKATVQPDSLLSAALFQTDGTIEFSDAPTAGKVDAYRYMAFFLAPDPGNFSEFTNTVVDPFWLANSMDPAAAALRQATAADNGAWRILYRVTYVSRIPPSFQPAPTQSPAPAFHAPVNLDANALLIQLVKQRIASENPTPLEIGTAVTQVLGTSDTPGTLGAVLPWWGGFLADSANYTLPAGEILRALREDLLEYITALYAAENQK